MNPAPTRIAWFLGSTLAALPAACLRRPGATLRQFERVAFGTLPIVAAAGVSVGVVTWLQARAALARFGLVETLPSLLSASLFIETGPMLASLLIAGRMGSGLAAELAAMRLTEELDARDLLGAPVVPNLVAPRVLACALAAPLLTELLDVAALLGAFLAELAAGGIAPALFARRVLDVARLSDIIPATLKTTLFGGLVGLVGCGTGYFAKPDAVSIGRAATQGVVRAMLAVFLADAALVPIVQAASNLLLRFD
ncbi:MAG: ABC transporter permease [Planctomycetota bacterium]|nr:ABC transporter permease [Planctomycetota bacterium]